MGQARIRGNRDQRITSLLDEHFAKALTPERYNAFIAWTRSPIADGIGEELEFFATKDENLIGVVIKDLSDRDFGFVILGRDEKGRFRGIDVNMSMPRTEARHGLLRSLKRHSDTGESVFPQGDKDVAGVDLFSPVTGPEKLHPMFKFIVESEHWIPGRSILSEMMRHFTDVDGNFVEQFQTTGFDSRTWELYLFAALLEQGLFVEKPTPAPDFMVSRGHKKVFIEAVTVNPTGNAPLPKPEDPPIERSSEEIRELLKTKIPIKFASPLWSKLTRKNPYWELDDVVGHPLIFAIADFHEKQAMTWTSTALMNYLYGVSHDFLYDDKGQLIITPIKVETHEYEGKQIPSGFFLQENAENISAILFSSSGTISKFNRMGKLAGFGLPEQQMIRAGFCHRHDNNAALPEYFVHEVKQGLVTETWAEGLSMFHNPRAKHSVDWRMFPGIAHHFCEEGHIRSLIPDFHPYTSYTWNLLPTKDASPDSPAMTT